MIVVIPPPGRTFAAQLGAPFAIATSPPTAPFSYGAGQPTVMATMTQNFRAGFVQVRADVQGLLENTGVSALEENQAFADFAIFVDGVEVSRAENNTWFEQVPTAFGGPGKFQSMHAHVVAPLVGLTAGLHTIDVRAGCSGAGPRASFTCDPTIAPVTMPFDFAVLSATEVFA
jgi:hypothetical protein